MAKISKSVKEKRKDFAKTKLKVGKTKQVPANHTDTTFRSKAVVLPKQSVTQEANVKEGQTLSHLLALLSHKSGDTRKDALQQLTTYLISHPPRLSTIITPLMKAICPLIIDDTTSVRKMLLEMLSTVLCKLTRQTLNSHVKHLLLYISSAMTHISANIRADSTKFLDWTLKNTNAIESIVADQLEQFLNTFSTLFGWMSQSASISSSKVLSFHLTCFHHLVQAALEESSSTVAAGLKFEIPVGFDREIFIPHRATEHLVNSPQTLSIFSSSKKLDADASNYNLIEPHLEVLLKYVSDKFIDSVNADKSLCLPILHIIRTLALNPQTKLRKDFLQALHQIDRGVNILEDSAGQGHTQGVVGEWRAIKFDLK